MKELIGKKDFETLLNYDQVTSVLLSFFFLFSRYMSANVDTKPLHLCAPQLKRQIDEEAVFVGFVEGEINFQPTYKYDTGSDKWDTR